MDSAACPSEQRAVGGPTTKLAVAGGPRVRIHLPPAASLQTFGLSLPRSAVIGGRGRRPPSRTFGARCASKTNMTDMPRMNTLRRLLTEDAARLHCQSSVWTKAQFAGWDPSYCFDRDTAGLFLIVQSSSTISLEVICRRLNPHLPITRPVTASLTHRLRSLWEDIRTVDGLFSWCDRSMGLRASRKPARARGRRRLWRHNLPPRARSVDGFKRTPPTVALAEGLLIGQC